MRQTVLYALRDVRVDEYAEPTILFPTDVIIQLSATCICGSDLWPYRGVDTVGQPSPIGHEYAGIVREVGSAVRNVKVGQFVVGSFFASDNTCQICTAGYQSACIHRELVRGAQCL
jgi:threonine dehydrogenase-like Zn-dependent dehydrogenase